MLTLITLYTPLKKCPVKDAPLGQSTGSNPNPPPRLCFVTCEAIDKKHIEKRQGKKQIAKTQRRCF